jgi:succinate dehydrogenase subunit C
MVDVREAVWKRRGDWWVHNRNYLLFMLREAGGSLSAVYGILLLGLLIMYSQGASAYANFLAFLESPAMLVVQAVILFFVLVHAVTWFYLIGKSQAAMSAYRAPPWTRIFALMIVVFLAASAGVLFIVFGGL